MLDPLDFLTDAQLFNLTRRKRQDAQARELENMGIPYAIRLDRSLAVLRAAVEARLGPPVTMATPSSRPRAPRLQP